MKQLIIVIIAITVFGCQKEEIRTSNFLIPERSAANPTSPLIGAWIHTATKLQGQSQYTFESNPETLIITQTHVVNYGPYAFTSFNFLLYMVDIDSVEDIQYTISGNIMTWTFENGTVWKLNRT